MPTIEQLIQSIDGRIRELNTEIDSLQDARAALIANGSTSTASGQPRQTRPVRRQRVRRAARSAKRRNLNSLTAETAERMLSESEGLTTTALAEQAGVARDKVLTLMRELEQANRVRRTGQRRGTRWHAITEEDRIRERAAELASRPKGRKAA
jgi:hypothetical protein